MDRSSFEGADNASIATVVTLHSNAEPVPRSQLGFLKYGNRYFLHRVLSASNSSMDLDIATGRLRGSQSRSKAQHQTANLWSCGETPHPGAGNKNIPGAGLPQFHWRSGALQPTTSLQAGGGQQTHPFQAQTCKFRFLEVAMSTLGSLKRAPASTFLIEQHADENVSLRNSKPRRSSDFCAGDLQQVAFGWENSGR